MEGLLIDGHGIVLLLNVNECKHDLLRLSGSVRILLDSILLFITFLNAMCN